MAEQDHAGVSPNVPNALRLDSLLVRASQKANPATCRDILCTIFAASLKLWKRARW
jgi:hypothetical protein